MGHGDARVPHGGRSADVHSHRLHTLRLDNHRNLVDGYQRDVQSRGDGDGVSEVIPMSVDYTRCGLRITLALCEGRAPVLLLSRRIAAARSEEPKS